MMKRSLVVGIGLAVVIASSVGSSKQARADGDSAAPVIPPIVDQAAATPPLSDQASASPPVQPGPLAPTASVPVLPSAAPSTALQTAAPPIVVVSVQGPRAVLAPAKAPTKAKSASGGATTDCVLPGHRLRPSDVVCATGSWSIGVGAGVLHGNDSRVGGYNQSYASIDVTNTRSFLGNYGLAKIELDGGKMQGSVPFVAGSVSGHGGWEVVAPDGPIHAGHLHIGIEPLNINAQGSTRIAGTVASSEYQSLMKSNTQQALNAGATPDQVFQAKKAALDKVRNYFPLDDNGQFAGGTNYAYESLEASIGYKALICRDKGDFLALARGGVSVATTGSSDKLKDHVGPTAGAAVYVNCGDLRAALEGTHLNNAGGSLDTAELEASYNLSKHFALGLSAKAVRESRSEKFLPEMSPAGDHLDSFQLSATARVTTESFATTPPKKETSTQ